MINIYDEKIKKAEKEIEKLLADIEKKKERIAQLRVEKKQYESDKARDSEFSNRLIKLITDNDIKTDEERKIIFSKFEEFMIERELEKSENSQITENSNTEEIIKNENEQTIKLDENSKIEQTNQTVNYQNITYSQKPTSNGNIIS